MKLESQNGITADVSMLCPQLEAKNLSNKDKLTIMRDNVTQVLLKSTLMPFRWLRSAYRCFYCYEMFQEPKDLKAHQTQHNDQDIPRVMKTYWEPVVYADVSSISCKLCPERTADLNELIDHLTSQHEMRFDQRLKNCFGSFKLNDSSVACVQCAKTFSSLSHLLIHANKDHIEESRVLCDICGQNFQSASRLRHHTKKEHEDNAVKCTICGEMIGSVNKMRTHLQHAHNKRYKCFLCSDSFETHYKRSHHMMVFHKERKEIKCQYCSRTFVYRSTMVRHVREMHLQEKNAVCNICGWKAFGVNRLQLHMMKHSDVRNFKCTVCDKAFKTKKTMRQHYNNIHQKGIKKGTQIQIST